MAWLTQTLRDDAVALAKRWMHPAVEVRHVHAALCRRDDVRVGVDPDRLPSLEELLGDFGVATAAPLITDEAEELLHSCTDLSAAQAALAKLSGALRQGDAEPKLQVDSQQHVLVNEGHQSTLEDSLAALDRLAGITPVKTAIQALVNRHRLNAERATRGLPTVPVGMHLVFTGNPGTGKTTVARIVADVYRGLGLLPSGHLVEVQRADLVAGYVGQTALKVQNVVQQALGGVLFIDEAYALIGNSDNDYGTEAIATLVKLMEDHRDQLAVIVAGYTADMSRFINANQGLRSRFQQFIEFPDFDDDGLLEIFSSMAQDHHIRIEPNVHEGLRRLINSAPPEYRMGNGRFVRNLFETMYARMATRVHVDGVVTDDELEAFAVDDVPALGAKDTDHLPGYL